jgi:hypothetical protein
MDVTLKLRLETVREIERISPVLRKTRQTRQAGSLSYGRKADGTRSVPATLVGVG